LGAWMEAIVGDCADGFLVSVAIKKCTPSESCVIDYPMQV
jgi:hypothetical protein